MTPVSKPGQGERPVGLSRIWIAIVLILIAYASLYPFNFHPALLFEALRGNWLGAILGARSGTVDLIANFFFYLPLGYVVIATRSTPGGWLSSLALSGLAAMTTSTALEILQFSTPGRTPSIVDIVLNVAGSLLGGLLGKAAPDYRFAYQRLGWIRTSGVDPVALTLMAGWVALKAAPFIPQLGFYRALQSLQPLRRMNWSLVDIAAQFAVYLLALAALRTIVQRKYFWRLAAFLCVMTVACQVLIIGHRLTLSEVLACVAAVVVTGAMRHRRTASTLPVVFGMVLVCIVVGGLSPYRLTTAQPFHWIPFVATLESTVDSGYFALTTKVLLYGGCLWAGMRSRLGLAGATFLLFCVTSLVEVSQIFLPGRQAEIIDPAMVVFLAIVLSGQWARIPTGTVYTNRAAREGRREC